MPSAVAEHRRVPARAPTSPLVSTLLVVACEDDTPVMAVPRPEPQIVARFGPSVHAGLEVHALGAGLTVRRKDGGPGHGAIVARFRLGTSTTALGASASDVANRIVPLEELWGPAATGRLLDRLGAARDVDDAARILDRAIAERVAEARVDAHVRLALHAAHRLAESSVSAVADALAVSERHLRRIFQDAIGVSPKTYSRLTRFHRAVRAARRGGAVNWADIAADAGYYDQAHLIAEFRAIAGASPRAFINELSTALSLV